MSRNVPENKKQEGMGHTTCGEDSLIISKEDKTKIHSVFDETSLNSNKEKFLIMLIMLIKLASLTQPIVNIPLTAGSEQRWNSAH